MAEVEKIGNFDDFEDKFNDEPGKQLGENGIYDIYSNKYDPYPTWNPPEAVPITRRILKLFSCN